MLVANTGITSRGPFNEMLKNILGRGTWVAQSVERLTLDFGSGHDLTVRGFEPRVGFWADSAEPA